MKIYKNFSLPLDDVIVFVLDDDNLLTSCGLFGRSIRSLLIKSTGFSVNKILCRCDDMGFDKCS